MLTGQYAPMPPVLGPVSPSPSRLWSCAAGRTTSCSPSVSASTESSSPSRKSSTTTSAGVAERSVREHGVHRAGRLVPCGADDRALAARESGGLHHEGLRVTLDVDEGWVEG